MDKQNRNNQSLFAKILGNSATADEVQRFKCWLDSNAENKHEFEQYKSVWMSSKYAKTYDLKSARNKINVKINEKLKQKRDLSLFIRKIAAVLILPLLLASAIYWYTYQSKSNTESLIEIRSPLSGKTHFELPDGTKGMLNNGSIIQYSVLFNENRKVNLIGEAFFDVTHTGVPFHVLTKDLDVKVMGTTFNVIAWNEDHTEEVTLASGKVNVSLRSGEPLAALTPNQQLVLNKESQKHSLNSIDAEQLIAWTKGELIFRNERLEQVVKRLSRWYNVDFEFIDPELKDYTFHATFLDEPLDEVLKLLAITAPVSYQELPRKIKSNDNIYERRQIKLMLNRKNR